MGSVAVISGLRMLLIVMMGGPEAAEGQSNTVAAIVPIHPQVMVVLRAVVGLSSPTGLPAMVVEAVC